MRLTPAALMFFVFATTRAWAQVPARAEQDPPPSPPAPEYRTAMWRGMLVHYEMKNGLPVYQGDIILDNLVPGPNPTSSSLPGRAAPEIASPVSSRAFGVIYPSSLWPAVNGVHQIPYTTNSDTAVLETAIAQYNMIFSGVIQWVPRTTESDYVNFFLDPSGPGGGSSNVGRTGGQQRLYCGGVCNVGTLHHEMGHATGLFHEHIRPDRDSYITVDDSHRLATSVQNDFGHTRQTSDAWLYGPFNYSSIMMYGMTTASADNVPSIQSIPPGIILGGWALQPNGTLYTSGDIDTIRRLYGADPTYVTVDTNPQGLQLIVDGQTITTPQTYTSWTLNSTHTLAIPTGLPGSGMQVMADAAFPQSQGQFYYQFARWNDGGSASHTITITPGNGLPGYPATAPAQTVYMADFIQRTPFLPSPNGSSPSGAGTMTADPAPETFAGAGPLFVSEQSVVLTAVPNPGYNFLRWALSYVCVICPSSFSANPLNLFIYTARGIAPTFTKSQVTTIATDPPGLQVQVDGKSYGSPARFTLDPSYDGSSWAPGTSHTVTVTSPQNPWSSNTSYVFSGWSDGLAQSHQVTVPTGNSTLTAKFKTLVGLVTATNSSGNCAGSLAATPASPVSQGTPVTFTATPNYPFVFVKWEGALSGSANPSTGLVNQEEFVQADFNTIASPLSITSLSPASVQAGSGPLTLTINGTGFTPYSSGSLVRIWYNNGKPVTLTKTYVSSTQLQVSIPAANIATPGAIQIAIDNFNSDYSCTVATSSQLIVSPVQAASAPVLLRISAVGTGNFTQGKDTATYSLVVSNARGGSPSTGAVTVTETLPAGMTLVSMTGQGWTCSNPTCARSDTLNPGASYPPITVTVSLAANAPAQVTNRVCVSGGGAPPDYESVTTAVAQIPAITSGGVVPVYSTASTIQPGEWVSIYGANLSSGTATWKGDFPVSLAGTSVTINGRQAYLSYVSPTQINLQAPNDTTVGQVPVVVTTAIGSGKSAVTLAQFAPSFLLLDSSHVAGIILRSKGEGAYGGGAYDILGPTGTALGYPTVAAKAGDVIELFGTGFGPTDPLVTAGQPFSGSAPTTSQVTVRLNNVTVPQSFVGISGAGLYQVNLTVPSGLGTGDVTLRAVVGGVQTPAGVVISVQ